MSRMDTAHADKAVIDALGGPAEVARKLGLDPSAGGVQRVFNWTRRGIPDAIRWQHREIFGDQPTVQPAQAAAIGAARTEA